VVDFLTCYPPEPANDPSQTVITNTLNGGAGNLTGWMSSYKIATSTTTIMK